MQLTASVRISVTVENAAVSLALLDLVCCMTHVVSVATVQMLNAECCTMHARVMQSSKMLLLSDDHQQPNYLVSIVRNIWHDVYKDAVTATLQLDCHLCFLLLLSSRCNQLTPLCALVSGSSSS